MRMVSTLRLLVILTLTLVPTAAHGAGGLSHHPVVGRAAHAALGAASTPPMGVFRTAGTAEDRSNGETPARKGRA